MGLASVNRFKSFLRNGMSRLLWTFVEAAKFAADVTRQGGERSSVCGAVAPAAGCGTTNPRRTLYDWEKQGDFANRRP